MGREECGVTIVVHDITNTVDGLKVVRNCMSVLIDGRQVWVAGGGTCLEDLYGWIGR
jgi:hypothetical protein